MVGQDEIRVPGQGLVDNGGHRVYREQHAPDRCVGIAADEAHRVPIPRPGWVIHLLEDSDDAGKSWNPRIGGHAAHCTGHIASSARYPRDLA